MTRTDKLTVFAALILLSISIYVHFIAGYVGDKNWLLMATRMWLGGKKLYVDIFETNPPLIIWIYALPVYISLHFPFFQDSYGVVSLGLCVVGFSIFISNRLIALHPEFVRDRRKRMQFVALLGFIFVFSTNPAYFFDREHVFLVLIFPYILRWMPSLSGQNPPRYLRVITGILAGIGFCIKPHCVIVFVGLQLIYFLRERSLRILVSIENILIYAAVLLYLLSIWFFTPEYISVVLPMLLATYSAHNRRVSGLTFLVPGLFILAATFVDFRLRYASPYRKDIFYLLSVCAFLLLYALANNGWGYTYSPLSSILLVVTGFVLWDCFYLKEDHESRGLPSKQFLFCARACMINFAVNTTFVMFISFLALTAHCEDTNECRGYEAFQNMVKDNHAHSFGTLVLNFGICPQLFRATGATLETRFHFLWMLIKFVASGPDFTAKHQWILDYVANALAQDLNHNKPDIMIVDNSPEFFTTGKHVDLVAYFSVFPNFKKAWQHYHYVQTIDSCSKPEKPKKSAGDSDKAECRYDIYKRRP